MSNKKDIQKMLLSMGFQSNYIKRAFKVFVKNYGHSYNVEVITEIMTRLQRKDIYQRLPYYKHFDTKWLSALKVNDNIDHRDSTGKFRNATIIDKDNTILTIKYFNNERVVSDYAVEPFKFAKQFFIKTRRVRSKLKAIKVGDSVDINPILQHPNIGWISGQIKEKDKNGELYIAYTMNTDGIDYQHKYWVHLENEQEIAEFTSKCASTLNVPYPQSPTRSKKIVLQYVRNCYDLFPKNTSLQIIPLPISYCILSFYHNNTIYPILSKSDINDKYNLNDSVKFYTNHVWIDTVISDKENNWIVLKQKTDNNLIYNVHIHKQNNSIYKVPEDKVWKVIPTSNWRLVNVADRGGLCALFATEIKGNLQDLPGYLSMFEQLYDKYMTENKQYFEDASDTEIDIDILSEFCNVRAYVYQYDDMNNKLFVSEKYGEYEESMNSPIILILRHNNCYYLMRDDNASHMRPLKTSYTSCNNNILLSHQSNLNILRLKRILREKEQIIMKLLQQNKNGTI